MSSNAAYDTGIDRLDVPAAVVEQLIATQFPQWAGLPVRKAARDGWDNNTFRVGDTLKARLPSARRYVAGVEKENRFLPRLAPHLPVAIPVPLAVGAAGAGYPYPWSVYPWFDGETASRQRVADLPAFARDLARFLLALHRIDATDGPPAGAHNFFRGGSLAVYDAQTRASIGRLGNRIDAVAALATWEAALSSEWTGRPVWVHGDVAVGNLLVDDGRLSAVIDFGTCGVGDPACDLVIAWLLFDRESRLAFRATLRLDEGMWTRARGWALWKALLVYSESQTVTPAETPPEQVIAAVLAE